MRVIGITGGVGSGKSCVLDFLKSNYGAKVIQADLVAKQVMEPGQPGYERLVVALGENILQEGGRIDRAKLSQMMFHDVSVIEQVNGIIHPMVWQTIKHQIEDSEEDLVVVEEALPGENHSDIYAELWYVYTSEENRIQRLSESRGYTREKSLSIMANQPTEDAFRLMADNVIDNNGSIEETRRQVTTILDDKEQ